MAYWKTTTGISTTALDINEFGSGGGRAGSSTAEFYEIEPGVVLDIILDNTHPYFNGFKTDPNRTPKDVEGKKPLSTDPDYTWVGRALVRLIYTQKRLEKEDCVWALPLESNVSEYPLLNEIVAVYKYMENYYYSRKINNSNFVNANPNFNVELESGGFRDSDTSPIQGNRELQINSSNLQQSKYKAYQGPKSSLNVNNTNGWSGVLGRYFLFNERIRSLKRREGDMIFESRFGQSIRFAAYDDNRSNDKGYSDDFAGYKDYKRSGIKYKVPVSPNSTESVEYEAGCGNPMILIRNRQRPISPVGKTVEVYPLPVPPVTGTAEEKNAGGYLVEDINNDGSSIHLTSGTTLSGFVTTCKKKMWGVGEEQSQFQGTTTFSYPKLIGDQITINSDRVVISSKKGEMFHFSKKRMAFVTDNEFTVDSHQQMVLTTNTKVVINSPAIYLGEYNQTNEPALLGQTSVNWLYDLCEWLRGHTHWYYHTHPDAGAASGPRTQQPIQTEALIKLRDNLNKLMSRRVFLVGGGLAPGQNGGEVDGGTPPTSIIVANGSGVPGGWGGLNRKYTATDPAPVGGGTDAVPSEDPGTFLTEASTAQDISEAGAESVEEAEEDSAAIAAALKEMKDILKKNPKNDSLKKSYNYSQKEAKEARKNTAAAKKAAKSSQKLLDSTKKMTNPYQISETKLKALEQADKAKYASKLADDNSKNVLGTLELMKKQTS